MIAEGATWREVGAVFGLTSGAARGRGHRVGIRSTWPGRRVEVWTPERVALVERLTAEGLIVARIAQHFGVSKSVLRSGMARARLRGAAE